MKMSQLTNFLYYTWAPQNWNESHSSSSVEVEVLHLVKFRDGVAHIPWCYDIIIQAVKQEKIRERKHTRKVKKITD